MGKPLSRPGCFRQSSCCLEKSVDGDGYNEDGYIPQRSIYDTMCINEQIDHGSAQSTITSRGGQDNNFSINGNLGVGTGACEDMITFESRSRSTTPIPSVGRRLDERVIFDQLKLVEAGQSSRSPGGFGGRSISPNVSLMAGPGGNSSSSGKRLHQHQHDSGKRGDNGRHSWKVLTPPKHLEHLELSSGDVMEKNFLNPLYPQNNMTSPLISPFSGSPISSGCHTPVFYSPAKPLPFQQQSFIFEESLPSQPHQPAPKPPLAQLSVTALQCVQEDLRRIGETDKEGEKTNEESKEIEKKREVSHSVGSMSQEENVGVFGFAQRSKALDSALDNDSPFSPDPTRDTTPLMLDQISPGPAPPHALSPQPMEYTWPRRLIVRKRTVRQGGALHNVPILPPLPSLVPLSAVERKNLPRLTPFSEHQGKLVGLMGRVGYSLKEQHLENWRIYSAKKPLQKPDKDEKGQEQECKSSDGDETSVNVGWPECKQDGRAADGGAEGEEVEVVEEWDAVLGLVNTLWDEGWGDADSFTGSLRQWPLLKPPSGFGGSHPPSSAASELSLPELEKSAKEVESELLAQQCLTDSLRKQVSQLTEEQMIVSERASRPEQIRTQTSLELPAMGCSTGTNNLKEDSSPDSNLTLESDSSGVFMSNPSQEDNASDGSDRPLTESDLGSNTSLDQDKEEVAFKDWGREESTELQWCYPSLLKSSSQSEGHGVEKEAPLMKDTEMDEPEPTSNKGLDHSHPHDGSTLLNQSELKPRNKSVKIISGSDSPLPLSPSRHEKPQKKSGLDSSDLDPFVATDSFVYLAVSVPTAVSMAQDNALSIPPLSKSTPGDSLAQSLCPNIEESDFLSTDSFVYLASPECHLLATEGHSSFICSSKESDSSDDSGSGVDFFLGSMVGDSDWDSDESESGPKTKSKPIKQPTWDLWEELEQEVLFDLFCEEINPVTQPMTVTEEVPIPISEQPRKVTWQFRAAEGSTRQTSKKDTSSSSSSSSSSSHSLTHTEV